MKINKKLIVISAIIIAAIFVTPIPYYQQQVLCKPGAMNCPQEGWHLSKSLLEKLMDNNVPQIIIK